MLSLQEFVQNRYNKTIAECSNEELYLALLNYSKLASSQKPVNTGKKKVYYISAEFLIGKLLSNNLINLGLYDDVKKELSDAGKDLIEVEEVELEPSLGNGGLGRLAACFIDSISSLGLTGDGVGLNYHFGLFQQVLKNNQQETIPNAWLTDQSWLVRSSRSYQVPFAHFTLTSTLYDIDVPGYKIDTKNRLRLFDLDSVDSSIIEDGINFDKTDIARNLTLFLYPDDSNRQGELLRIFQQYFMVSNGAQLIIDEAIEKGSNLHDLADYAVVQINDTHPSMVIPELIRLLTERGIGMDEAISIVRSMTAYTNHTILQEALEKWDQQLFKRVLPRVYQIILEIDNRYVAAMAGRGVAADVIERTRIVKDNQVHMANLAIIGGHSVNGVAKLHTELLKEDTLHDFYTIYPEKFNNKTNGIVQRRWTQIAAPELSAAIDDVIGNGWRNDIHELENLTTYLDDKEVLNQFYQVKKTAKQRLADYIKETTGVEVSTDAIFDVQVKRLHAYKRQLLNLLHIIKLYWDLKDNPDKDMVPRVFIFGAKAAPGYHFAKSVIKLINEVANLVNNDESLQGKLKVVFLENYRVSLAELIIPAADVSEQISLASKEASGTSNMKFMMTGAITLATLDGANIEIKDEVGDENVVIFGMDKDEVYEHYARHDYYSRAVYENNPVVRRVVDTFVNGTIPKAQAEGTEIYEALITHNDEYFLLEDFTAYVEAQEKIDALYRDHDKWARMSLANIAKSHKFTSDDTITEYAKEIWELKK